MAAGTILVREAIRRVSLLLGDLVPVQFNRYAEADLIAYLNDAALAVVTFLPGAGTRIDAIKLRPGTLQNIESIAAVDCVPGDGVALAAPVRGIRVLGTVCNMGDNGAKPGRAIRVVDQHSQDAVAPMWHAARSADEVRAMMFDPQAPTHMLVTPPVHATTPVWVRLKYVAAPVKVTIALAGDYATAGPGTTKIPLPDEHIDDLVNYTTARALMADTETADPGRAGVFAALFVDSVNAKGKLLTGTSPNLKRLPFAPEPIGAAS
jgi:hypothetical protein